MRPCMLPTHLLLVPLPLRVPSLRLWALASHPPHLSIILGPYSSATVLMLGSAALSVSCPLPRYTQDPMLTAPSRRITTHFPLMTKMSSLPSTPPGDSQSLVPLSSLLTQLSFPWFFISDEFNFLNSVSFAQKSLSVLLVHLCKSSPWIQLSAPIAPVPRAQSPTGHTNTPDLLHPLRPLVP